MSAIHGVRDIWAMNGPGFFSLAWRLPHYQGVLRDRARAEADEREDSSRPAQRQAPPGYAPANGHGPKPGTRTLIENDSTFRQIIGFG